ncbi:MBL fold metallo-hydrolase [Candidatus Nanohalobium constans]|uniref:Pyrroloquinoline quinone biosynthesis protein B n=1 Tax=Candidatus Nanohalobium constans TaxID=2565781 RepID=A0A5Q0UG24_9ARCH|nr:MBL fold metallo-hydrolase [Candidatus Nanohalobium constans]QGA80568.1 pyrroloquinoline quinone biosynthesis protein B [Candidatus Nanohalobium constans]
MKLEILGNVQDGGVPHLGCNCSVCDAAREDRDKIKYGHSVLLKENDNDDSIQYLIGASADIRFQTTGKIFDGIFLVDNHFTHLVGLLYLGEFSLEAENIPVYSPEFMENYLDNNDPYRYLKDRGNIQVQNMEDGETEDLQDGVEVTPFQTVKRTEHTGTLSYLIEGENKTIYYAPIIYQEWTDRELERIRDADVAIIEGCFYHSDEVGRYADNPPHPLMPDTMDELEDSDTEVIFTHLNHTNPALRENSEERAELEERGFKVAEKGMEIEL